MANHEENDKLLSYLKVHGAYEPKTVPGQNAFTFLAQRGGVPQLFKWTSNDGKIKALKDFHDRVLSVHPSPSGEKTIVGVDNHGDERQQLYLINQDHVIEELVISKNHFHRFGGWSSDEKRIVFSSNRRHPGYFDLYVADVATKTVTKLLEINDNCTPICWIKNDSQILISMPRTNIDNDLFVYDLAAEKLIRLTEVSDRTARFQSVQATADGKKMYVLSDAGQNTLGIFQKDLKEDTPFQKLMTDDSWDIEEIKLSPDEKSIAYTVNKGGISTLGCFHLENQQINEIADMPKGVYRSLDWLNADELIVAVKGATIPGDIWKVDVPQAKSERLTFVGENKTLEKYWIEPKLCTYQSFDGLTVPYFLYQQGEAKAAVVYVHGGPESQIRSEYNPVIQYLAANGYAVVTPNVRGSMGYGRKYVQLDDVRNRMDSVADLKWLAKDLIDKHHIHPDKIGIMGRSYGGFMVLAALTHYPGVWSAGVDIVGISHFRTFLENTGAWRRKLREFEYGSLEEDIDFFEEIAPLNHTDKITAPLLVFHGRNDTRVPVTEAEQLTSLLTKKGKEVELFMFEDEGHQTERLENHIFMNTEIVKFMNKHLKGE
ncbi:S9 family peptidase [Virgibacillus sp. 179-BFC.A HS]|uniref:S9 family peptidase n=1 Tax=Tigheibacillus jepli TaxID=3035914 RepID=A0ABU5CFZ7_9BACI|nr:S9 family peptidase [Virgibacillus sp. 179-BFC.A HS]MDY0404802.1 S9 family peptidase [Virgibacillus sp. 179-BFC.A HS]